MIKSSLEPLRIDMERTEEGITSYGGMPLPIDAWGALGVGKVAEQHLDLKKRKRGVSDSQWAEVLTMLLIAGGRHVEDLDWMKMDSGLAKMWPILDRVSPRSALNFLYRFHDKRLESSRQGMALIHTETKGLKALGVVNRHLICEVARRKPEPLATIDVDTSLHTATKRSALRSYEGDRGYQPLIAYWVEQQLVVGDQFRDGNVPPGMGNQQFVKDVVKHLPENVEKVRLRGDSALYEQKLLRWLERNGIKFAISADVGKELLAEIKKLKKPEWKPYPKIAEDGQLIETDRECAEVAFTPHEPGARKDESGFRYIAIRIPRPQGDLEEGHFYHFAVVSNRWDVDMVSLLNWQRKRCGTIEHVHDLLKNDMGARHFPSDRFGANAAWYRLNVLALNLLRAIMCLALSEEWHDVRPATMRFRLLRIASRIVSHSRQLSEIFSARAPDARDSIHAGRVHFDART